MTTEDAIRTVLGRDADQADVERVAMQILTEANTEWPEPKFAEILAAAVALGLRP